MKGPTEAGTKRFRNKGRTNGRSVRPCQEQVEREVIMISRYKQAERKEQLMQG